MSVVMGRRKPGARWLLSDTLAAMAWQEHVDSLCPGCGQPRHESMDPASEGRYVAPPPAVCHACDRIGVAQRAWTEEWRRVALDAPPGRYWSADLRDR